MGLQTCNRAKSDAWPSKEEQEAGLKLLDPSTDALSLHLARQGGEIVAYSELGEYYLEILDLNSELQRLRRQRREETLRAHEILEGRAREIGEADLLLQLSEIRRQAFPGIPNDAPDTCRCE